MLPQLAHRQSQIWSCYRHWWLLPSTRWWRQRLHGCITGLAAMEDALLCVARRRVVLGGIPYHGYERRGYCKSQPPCCCSRCVSRKKSCSARDREGLAAMPAMQYGGSHDHWRRKVVFSHLEGRGSQDRGVAWSPPPEVPLCGLGTRVESRILREGGKRRCFLCASLYVGFWVICGQPVVNLAPYIKKRKRKEREKLMRSFNSFLW